jgi:hypothetical protein
MVAQSPDLWTLARLRAQIDPHDLTDAIVRQVGANDLDYRSRLLIRDSIDALKSYWGESRFANWFQECPMRQEIEAICGEEFDKIGFPSLRKRLMERTTPEQIRDYLETLGRRIRKETRIYIAGSCALILPGLIDRGTEDVDVVDEVPKEIRDEHALLEELQKSYSLHMGHVQRHYFPAGWQDRAHSYASWGRLSVYLIDVYDIFLSKLFSARIKDLEDLRSLVPQIDKGILVDRFKRTCEGFLAAPRLKELAMGNWQILFKEDLPTT